MCLATPFLNASNRHPSLSMQAEFPALLPKGHAVMKRNLLAGLILLLGVPAAALAADAKHVKKNSVVAQAGSPSAKSDAAAKSTKKKGKAAKSKASKATKNAADKASQVK